MRLEWCSHSQTLARYYFGPSSDQFSHFPKICRSHRVFFHSDLAQMIGKVDIDVNAMNIDLASISSHKVNSFGSDMSLDNYFRFMDLKVVVLFIFDVNLVSDSNQSYLVVDRKEGFEVEHLLHIFVSDWELLRSYAEKR